MRAFWSRELLVYALGRVLMIGSSWGQFGMFGDGSLLDAASCRPMAGSSESFVGRTAGQNSFQSSRCRDERKEYHDGNDGSKIILTLNSAGRLAVLHDRALPLNLEETATAAG